MKLYAQQGFQNGNKLTRGFEENLLDGVIFSPRDMPVEKLVENLEKIENLSPGCDLLLDPQLYACFLARFTEARLGNLPNGYGHYFRDYQRRALERENEVAGALRSALQFQAGLPVTAFIAPNILIPASFNSIEAVIAKNFIRMTAAEHSRLQDKRPVYATLAVSREALLDKQELIDFLNEITVLDEAPAGFYILISARSNDATSDIFHTDVIAGWMLINHSLHVNGFQVINGYSDLVMPFLGAIGAEAGASGWWSNLRTFSLDRFSPAQGGGRQPIARYLSKVLLNRITYPELNQLRNLIPQIVNDLFTDAFYPEDQGSAPQDRTAEMLQSWDALKALNQTMHAKSLTQGLSNCLDAVATAKMTYDQIPILLDRKSQGEHMEALEEGILAFAERAEIKLPGKE